jgi:hypothetical protein
LQIQSWCCFSAILQKDGVTIGFMTFGDNMGHQEIHLAAFDKEYGCEITPCASRPFVRWRIQDQYEGGPPIEKEVLVNGTTFQRRKANVRDAIRMFERLEEVLVSISMPLG